MTLNIFCLFKYLLEFWIDSKNVLITNNSNIPFHWVRDQCQINLQTLLLPLLLTATTFFLLPFYCNLAIFPLQVWAHCSVGEVNKFWETLPCCYITEELEVREDPACEHHGLGSVLMAIVSLSLAPTEACEMSNRQYLSVWFCISLCGVLSPVNTASA